MPDGASVHPLYGRLRMRGSLQARTVTLAVLGTREFDCRRLQCEP